MNIQDEIRGMLQEIDKWLISKGIKETIYLKTLIKGNTKMTGTNATFLCAHELDEMVIKTNHAEIKAIFAKTFRQITKKLHKNIIDTKNLKLRIYAKDSPYNFTAYIFDGEKFSQISRQTPFSRTDREELSVFESVDLTLFEYPLVPYSSNNLTECLLFNIEGVKYVVEDSRLLRSFHKTPNFNIPITYNLPFCENNAIPFGERSELIDYFNTTFGIPYELIPQILKESTKHVCEFTGDSIYVFEHLPILPRTVGKTTASNKITYYYIDGKKRNFFKENKIVEKYDDESDTRYITTENDEDFENNYRRLHNSHKLGITRVNNYTYTPQMRFVTNSVLRKTPANNTLYFGVEMEVDHGGRDQTNVAGILGMISKNKPILYATSDSSLDNGFEFKTMPSCYNSLMNPKMFNFGRGFELAKLLHYSEVNDTSGLHIHISQKYFKTGFEISDVDNESVNHMSMIMMYNFIEVNWDFISAFSRRTENKLERWSPKYSGIIKQFLGNIGSAIDYSELSSRARYLYRDRQDGGRYALTVKGSNTFEFRFFRGTLDEVTLKAAIQLVNNLAIITKKRILDAIPKLKEGVNKKFVLELFNISVEEVVYYNNEPEIIKYVESLGGIK